MNEEEILDQDPMDQDPQEPVTTTVTEAPEAQSSTTTTVVTSEIDYSEGFANNSENIIHQLFFSLGVDLDYVPTNVNQRFTMGLQLICALWFIWWFVKFLFTTVRDLFRP